jgi:hypothetical protein
MLFLKAGSPLYYYVFTKDNLLTIVLKLLNGVIPIVRTFNLADWDDPADYKIHIEWIDLFYNLRSGFIDLKINYNYWKRLMKNSFIKWNRDYFFFRLSDDIYDTLTTEYYHDH